MTFLHIVAGGAFEELQNFFSEWGRKNLKNNAETYYTNENQRVLLLALQTRNYSFIFSWKRSAFPFFSTGDSRKKA
jgi:hypothetical protein